MTGTILLPNSGCTMRYYPDLAREVGDRESLILLQMDYWLKHGLVAIDAEGRRWLKISQRQMAIEMGIAKSSFDQTIKGLVAAGMVSLKQSKRGGRNQATLDYAGLSKLKSITVKWLESGQEVAEVGPKVAEVGPHKDKDKEERKEVANATGGGGAIALLQAEIEALKKANADLQNKLEKKAAKGQPQPQPEDLIEAIQYLRETFGKDYPGLGMAAGMLAKARNKCPLAWPDVKSVIREAAQVRPKSLGPFIVSQLNSLQEGKALVEAAKADAQEDPHDPNMQEDKPLGFVYKRGFSHG